jgi:histidinol-phosphate aminotransferase
LHVAIALSLGAKTFLSFDERQRALAQHVGLPAGHSLMLGNGSDELIALLSLACHLPGAKALAPEPGFVMYAMSAKFQGLGYIPVSLREDFALDEAAMSAAIAEHQGGFQLLTPEDRAKAQAASPIGGRTVVKPAQPAAPRATSALVRSPAERCRHCLSTPIAPPSSRAARRRIAISSSGMGPSFC